MNPERLLRLYSRAWRERYGDEFLALFDDRTVQLPQVIDIVSGAIDAHLSSDVRATTVARRSAVHVEGDTAVLKTTKSICYNNADFPFSRRDAWLGAGVMLGASLVFTGVGLLFDRLGYEGLGDAAKSYAFPAGLLLSMPFTYVKGQSWKATCTLVGIPLAILAALTYIAVWL